MPDYFLILSVFMTMLMAKMVMFMILISVLILGTDRHQMHITNRAVPWLIIDFITLTSHWAVVLNLTFRLPCLF